MLKKDEIIGIGSGLVVLAIIIFIIVIAPHIKPPTPEPVPTVRETGLYDRNDIMIKENDVLSDGDQYLQNTVKYGMFEGQMQWYTVNKDGVMFVLKDLGDAPKEQRSVIVK